LIAWVAFAPLLWALPRLSIPQAISHGWLAGLVFQVGAASWYPGLMARYSGMYPAFAIALSVLVWTLQASTWGLWAGMACYFDERFPDTGKRRRLPMPPPLPQALLAAASFVAIERFAPTVFDGPVALTQAHFPWVAQIAEPAGIHAVSFLIVVTGFAIARRRPLLLVLPTIALVFGGWRIGLVRADREAAPAARLGIVQEGRIPEGWSKPPEDGEVATRYQAATVRLEQHEHLDLVVWPEKAWPELLRSDSQHDYAERHSKRIRKGFSSPLMFGVTSVEVASKQLSNSAAVSEPDGKLTVFYDKVELIPYSESAYRAGTRLEPYRFPGLPVGVMICFESTFAAHARKLVEHGAGLLVNLSDDTWFGASAEPEQHFAHAVFRAIETRRDVLRASAAGPSACIAATGEVGTRSASGPGTLTCEARILSKRAWGLGDGFPIACLIAGLGTVLVIECRRRWRQEVRSRRSP